MYYAHSTEDPDRDRWQRLAEHLANVSREAAARAELFGAGRTAALAGLFHDLGKYAPAFQAYISGNGESPDHATAGAREILVLGLSGKDGFAAQLAALCVAGHHTGLPDRVGGGASFDERVVKKTLPALDPVWRQEIVPDVAHLFPPGFRGHESGHKQLASLQLALLGRMVFSCLVDADYRDTEAFCAAARGESIDREWPALKEIVNGLIARFDAHMAGIAANAMDTPVNRLRAEILAQVRAKAALPKGVFTLTVPTGGGKTLASLGFALDHARHHGLRRIVYAIPFTSIIDQTVDIFESVFGKDVVLEHHSAIEQVKTRESGERDVRDKMRLAMEDWAAPIVVTTNVQLLESLFAARPSRCRKLHSLADAVIVLDEAQTIPLHVLTRRSWRSTNWRAILDVRSCCARRPSQR